MLHTSIGRLSSHRGGEADGALSGCTAPNLCRMGSSGALVPWLLTRLSTCKPKLC